MLRKILLHLHCVILFFAIIFGALSGTQVLHAQNCQANFMFTLNNLSVEFMDMSVSTDGSPVVSWLWDFDDGTTSTTQHPVHSFATPDKYKVCLEIETANGCQNDICIDVEMCELTITAIVDENCNPDGQVTVSVTINDLYDSAKNITVSLDGQVLPGSPFNIDDVAPVVLNLPVSGDGLPHTIEAVSENVAGCVQSAAFSTPDCFSDCFLSGLNAAITGGTLHTVAVNDNFFSPQTLTVTVGDVVRFNWIGSGHTTTSDATSGPDVWNSGLLSAGATYDVLIKNPGTHRYYCIPHGGPGGAGMSGMVVANCPAGGQFNVQVSFNTSVASAEGYRVLFDGVPVTGSPFAYSGTGANTNGISVAGDGLPHTIAIQDVADPTCLVEKPFTAPDCGAAPPCSLSASAVLNGGCNGLTAPYLLTVNAINGSPGGFTLLIDGVPAPNSPIPYNPAGPTVVALSLSGNGLAHTIQVQDAALAAACSDAFTVVTPNCSLPCSLSGLTASVGTSATHVVQVQDFQFVPADLTVTVGDVVQFVWTGAVQHTSTSDATAGALFWNSGLHGNGFVYEVTVSEAGTHGYYCIPHGAPGGIGMAGTITAMPPCNEGLVAVQTSFAATNGSSSGYHIILDGAILNTTPFNYDVSGSNTQTVLIAGDGLTHTLTVQDVADAACTASVTLTAPDCSFTPPCSITATASVLPGCNNGSAEVMIHTQTANGGTGFTAYIDGVQVPGSPFVYDASGINMLTLSVNGDGNLHTFTAQDTQYPECSATTTFTVPNCSLPCSLSGLTASVGTSATHVVQVQDFQFVPASLTVTVGDVVQFVWTGAVQHTSTSDATAGALFWNSGLHGNGFVYEVTVSEAGTHGYYCIPHGAPGGIGMAGTITALPPCNEGLVAVQTSFAATNGSSSGYHIILDGAILNTTPFNYDVSGSNTQTVLIAGDGLTHTLTVQDVADAGCSQSIALFLPDCGVAPPCSLSVLAEQVSGCNELNQVNLLLTITSANTSESGFNVYVDGMPIAGNPFTYNSSGQTTLTVPVTGTGNERNISIQDTGNAGCTAMVNITTPLCGELCQISSINAVSGTASTHVVEVRDYSFYPSSLDIVEGDTVRFIWTGVVPHTSTSDALSGPGSWNSGLLEQGAVYDVVLGSLGTHPYYCIPHGGPGGIGMSGVINVLPLCNGEEAAVSVSFSVTNGSVNGYSVFIDGESAGTGTFSYSNTSGNNQLIVMMPGNNEQHTITIQDADTPVCAATVFVNSPQCGADCVIEGLNAATGSDIIHVVEVRDFEFVPAVLDITAGETVLFVWTGVIPHTSTSDALSGADVWNSGLLTQGASYAVTINEAGTHPYYCIPHGGPGGIGMAGVINALPPCGENEVQVMLEFVADGGSAGGYWIYADGIPLPGNPYAYDNPSGNNRQIIGIAGDGGTHAITVQDSDNAICAATTFVATQDCTPDCLLENLSVSVSGQPVNHTVAVADFEFIPSELEINLGDTVTFVWTGAFPHTSTSDAVSGNNTWNSGLLTQGATYQVVLTETGLHGYYCIPHGAPGGIGMAGSIVVNPPCNNNGQVAAIVAFTSENGSTSGFNLLVDGIPDSGNPYLYHPSGNNVVEILLAGDGAVHTLAVTDTETSGCTVLTEVTTPDCTPEAPCLAAYSYEAQGLEVSFYNISATGAPIDSYTWNLGNGVTITNSATPVYTYNEAGTYNVCLTITADTCTASYCLNITLTDACTGFASGFSVASLGQLSYQFTDASLGSTANEWLWGFGDGAISFEQNPFHEYEQPGNYTVCLVVQDTLNNCLDTYCTELLVTGVENIFSPNGVLCLNIYPNPVSNHELVVDGFAQSDAGSVAILKLFGLQGSLVMQTTIKVDNKLQLSLPKDIVTGCYLLEIAADTQIYRGKVLILQP
ncbi:PKD domain-containing protein [Sphingobacteriales bacterium UPWRP_1]|nr:hypothetical protein BVG80_12460 [Sphingobacteriales bacterium TSM_CSM]PSJ77842.1 PKD domain-containing protein [Sphingobacteriales bacterium UPWRP_1]